MKLLKGEKGEQDMVRLENKEEIECSKVIKEAVFTQLEETKGISPLVVNKVKDAIEDVFFTCGVGIFEAC